jgi:hypothetical protein
VRGRDHNCQDVLQLCQYAISRAPDHRLVGVGPSPCYLQCGWVFAQAEPMRMRDDAQIVTATLGCNQNVAV